MGVNYENFIQLKRYQFVNHHIAPVRVSRTGISSIMVRETRTTAVTAAEQIKNIKNNPSINFHEKPLPRFVSHESE